jgi:DNA-binding CsgD family transcriptional regulator
VGAAGRFRPSPGGKTRGNPIIEDENNAGWKKGQGIGDYLWITQGKLWVICGSLVERDGGFLIGDIDLRTNVLYNTFMIKQIEGLLERMGLKGAGKGRVFRFEERIELALVELARREQKPVEEEAADLMAWAIDQNITGVNFQDRWQSLSGREQQITALTCLGYTNRQIAAKLNVSENTVMSHVKKALRKFNMHGKLEMITALKGWDFSEWE